MIDLSTAYEVRDILSNELISEIEDEFGNIWYESFKNLTTIGKPPIILEKCKDAYLLDYKIYGESVQNGEEENTKLPSDYQQVEYIEGTGTQYINTDIIPNQNIGFDIEFLTKDLIATSGYGCILGARKASGDNDFQLTTYTASSDTSFKGTLRFGTDVRISAGLTTDKKLKCSLRNKVYKNDDGVTTELTGTFNALVPISLFALNNNGTITQYGNVQLYSLKLYSNDTLVRDFIPCYRKTDNVIGIYDLVENKFYTNEGTGTFLKGNGIGATPTSDTPIEIESVGDKTINLFDNDIDAINVGKDGNDLVLTNYSCSTGIKPSEFLEMTGLKAGDTFTVKRSFTTEKGTSNNVTGAMRFLKSSSGNWQLISGTQSINTATIPSDFNDTNYTYLYLYGALTRDENGELLTRFSNVQIVKGSYTTSTIPAYEPYGYRIPVKVRGKNLIEYPYTDTTKTLNGVTIIDNGDGTLTLNGTATTNFTFNIINTRYHMWDGLKKGNMYTIKLQAEGNYSGSFSLTCNYYYDETNTYKAWLSANVNKSNTKLIPEDMIGLRSYIYIYSGATFENTILKPQLVLGEISTGYEPYIEPFSTNIYLKEPLRKIDEYVDYIDFKKGKVFRKIYNEFFKTVTSTSSEVTTYKKFITNISKKPLLKSTNPSSTNAGDMMGYAISNKFVQSKVNYNNLGKYPNLIQTYITTTGGNRIASTFDDSSITTVAQANEKLGDGFDVCYVLEKEIEETIELPNIPTFKGTTIIEVDTSILPSNMEVEYKGKR